MILCACTFFVSPKAYASEKYPPNELWGVLLAKHVTEEGVAYHDFLNDKKSLESHLKWMDGVKVHELSLNAQKAFWINLYNACTVNLVLEHYPVTSIKKIKRFIFFGSPWDIKFCSSQGKKISLNFIEHEVIRKNFKDPRIHFALNCASQSCPILRSEAFDEIKIEDQLDDQAKSFLKNNFKNKIDIKNKKIYLSKIFQWYTSDFGSSEQDVLKFIQKYFSIEERKYVLASDMRVEYLNYNWELNDRKSVKNIN